MLRKRKNDEMRVEIVGWLHDMFASKHKHDMHMHARASIQSTDKPKHAIIRAVYYIHMHAIIDAIYSAHMHAHAINRATQCIDMHAHAINGAIYPIHMHAMQSLK
ncbi:hypothetical protein X798_07032 [Onchocerca flexuosa]|uniref:Uncharacterized protein n=2 Tax=Onchocerca flexuosa TaxID=387005 RepID=A0A183HMC7_9BILA|nr:hypothetical protein X798_07032 [Onchocerca flexuosa]VDO56671.1 unnamed protein product [Onchocerca flexuosa]